MGVSMFNVGKKYDVFISYRREGGEWIARSLYYYLDRRGLRCFLDHYDIPNGHFDDAVRGSIRDSDYFFSVIAEGALPVRGDGDWFAWEWDCAKELRADDHIIPLVVGDPCDAATLDAFTGTVNRYPMDAGAKFERDVDDVIKRCDSLKEKIEKLARRGEAARTKAEKKFRTRSEKRLRKMSSMGITLYDPKCKCVRDELVADALQRGLTQLQAKDVLEEIDKVLDDERIGEDGLPRIQRSCVSCVWWQRFLAHVLFTMLHGLSTEGCRWSAVRRLMRSRRWLCAGWVGYGRRSPISATAHSRNCPGACVDVRRFRRDEDARQ